MGTIYRTKSKEMWLIKIDAKKKIKSLYEKNKALLSTNKNNNNGKCGSD